MTFRSCLVFCGFFLLFFCLLVIFSVLQFDRHLLYVQYGCESSMQSAILLLFESPLQFVITVGCCWFLFLSSLL